MAEGLKVRYDPRDLSTIFVRRSNGHFVEARYRTLWATGNQSVGTQRGRQAPYRNGPKGNRRGHDLQISSRTTGNRGWRATAQARRNRERRPAGAKEKQSDIRLRDIDMTAAALHQDNDGSSWDES